MKALETLGAARVLDKGLAACRALEAGKFSVNKTLLVPVYAHVGLGTLLEKDLAACRALKAGQSWC